MTYLVRKEAINDTNRVRDNYVRFVSLIASLRTRYVICDVCAITNAAILSLTHLFLIVYVFTSVVCEHSIA